MQLRQDGLAWHVAGDDVVVLDLEGSVYLRLNGSAGFLWQRLAEPASDVELMDSLVANYGIDADRAAADVDAFVTQLRERGLLEI